MQLLLLVALGGGIGAALRFLVSRSMARAGTTFPWATLTVNVTGSLLLGLILPWLAGDPETARWRAFLGLGVLGAFTTFSTFSYDVVVLSGEQGYRRAAAYVGMSLILGLAAIAAGIAVGSRLA